jgi:hypothetical protein
MTTNTYAPFIGYGQIWARKAGSNDPMIEIGNCSKVEIQVKDKKIDLPNYKKKGGGKYAQIVRIDSAMISLVAHDLTDRNIRMGIFGSDAVVPAGTVVDEVVHCYKGALTPIKHLSPVVTSVKSMDGTTTYVADTDYQVHAGGLLITSNSTIADATDVKVSYTYAGHSKIEAMTTSSIVLQMRFVGANEADGKPVMVDIHRAQMSAAKALSLISDKFADLALDAEILVDETKTGDDISQYFVLQMG